ncbi:HET-domain-containing protein [Pyrenochaeta sp. DS3sAY3a]|nr:HET-domain-containing protein [Pyrenochaeta sp. DS3sAY3a]
MEDTQQQSPEHDLKLCAECQKLDLDACFKTSTNFFQRVSGSSQLLSDNLHKTLNGTFFYNDAIPIHKFGSRLAEHTDCPMCLFFQSLRIQPHEHKHHKLLAFRSSHSWLFRADRLQNIAEEVEDLKTFKDSVLMAVVPDIQEIPLNGYVYNWLDCDVPRTGGICLSQIESDDGNDKVLLSARELDTKFDIDQVRFWLHLCQQSHGSACRQRASQEPVKKGFRLIDCTQHPPIVKEQEWGVPYASLSYVWGDGATEGEAWPKTVVDAMEVTRSLGLQHLWVDRCCIDQTNAEERSYVISRMTSIYEGAEFTIIATAGEDAHHGLPGVGSTPRIPQPKIRLKSGNTLLSLLRDPRQDILESKYYTRGWTYQESVLSNRRIVFTDSQVYWECNCMATHESISMTLFHKYTSDQTEQHTVMEDFMLSGIFKSGSHGGSSREGDNSIISDDKAYRLDYGFPTHQEITIGDQLRGLDEHIREFSRRKLSFERDALLAFKGIVGLYAPIPQLCVYLGIPTWKGDILGAAGGFQLSFALSASSWYHRAGPTHHMFVSESCRRNTNLPSWTWAGWTGTVTWRAPPDAEHAAYLRDLVLAPSASLIWAAEISLNRPDRRRPTQLMGSRSARAVADESATLLEVKDPFVLNSWDREATSEKADWDEKWYRVGRRLSCIGMSVAMTGEEWTRLHASGEVISVLMFAGRYVHVEHGTARFLTLRRVQSVPERWERIGTLYLILPFLGKCQNVAGMFGKLPAKKEKWTVVIQ